MWIDSTGDITKINCGFIYPDGTYYGSDAYPEPLYKHEYVLEHFSIKEEPGVIRFCSRFIMLESVKNLRVKISDEYKIDTITDKQGELLKKWMSAQHGTITCPTVCSKEYQFRYLESLDNKLLTNIITL